MNDRDGSLTALAACVGRENVLTTAADIEPFGTDWRRKHHGVPLAVVRPATTTEASDVLCIAARRQIDVVPQRLSVATRVSLAALHLTRPARSCCCLPSD